MRSESVEENREPKKNAVNMVNYLWQNSKSNTMAQRLSFYQMVLELLDIHIYASLKMDLLDLNAKQKTIKLLEDYTKENLGDLE